MSRTVSATGYDDQRQQFVYLYELEYSTGTLYLTNAAADVSANGNTYQATGDLLQHTVVEETEDSRGQGVQIMLTGVDQSIISTLLSANFRGRDARIYFATYDPDTGAALGTPWLIFRGLQMSDYEIREKRSDNATESMVTVEISTRLSSLLGAVDNVRSVRANMESHNDMLQRAGVTTPSDGFFRRVPSLMNKKIFWGTTEGAKDYYTQGGGEGSGGTGRGADDNY